jgi:hypothetical protein
MISKELDVLENKETYNFAGFVEIELAAFVDLVW